MDLDLDGACPSQRKRPPRGSKSASLLPVVYYAYFYQATDPQDPDFCPQGSIFSLKWSPWLVEDGYRTATLAYLAKNHVGFRRIILYGEWERGELPDVVSERSDTTAICLPLSSDALLEWEDAVSGSCSLWSTRK